MYKYLLSLTASVALIFALNSTAHAQTAVFGFDDHNGSPSSGTYMPGNSFTFSISLAFTPGGNVANLDGLSYWFEQRNAAQTGPFYFSITNRDATGSQFTFLQSPGNIFPQPMNSQATPFGSNVKDLGGSTQSGVGVGAGAYFIANITISIDPSTPAGVYQIENTTAANKQSVISDDQGHTFGIAQSMYTITIVPEPSSLALCATGLPFALGFLRRSRAGRKS